MEFLLTRNRDAWFVIRGYKYQVDCTILRWVRLKEHHELELECGEDIDIVNRAALKGPSDLDRELQQIKHLDEPISLRSPACKTAIANAVQHFLNNPTLNLAFRFCTNSSSTTERPSVFDDRKSGIEVWNKVAKQELQAPEKAQRLEKLLVFLRQLERPSQGVDADTWNGFTQYFDAATADDLERFIGRFEWSTQGVGASEVSRDIILLLQADKGLSEEQAKSAYPRLFLRVMQILAISGKKTLNNKILADALALSPIRDSDTEMLEFVTSQLLSHTDRLDRLEAGLSQHEDDIAAIRRKILEKQFGSVLSPTLALAISEISTTLPPLVNAIAMRKGTVADLKLKLVTNDWLAIYGSVGSGKTQLATLLGQQFEHIVYVSLRDLNAAEASILLHHLFVNLSEGNGTKDLMQSGLTALANESVLILDDVPRCQTDDPLSRHLHAIADHVRPRNQHLLTISHTPISPGIVERLKPTKFLEILVPPLEVNDVKEVFERHGAGPGTISDEVSEAFLQTTHGNPTLLTAVTRRIEAKGWDRLEEVRSEMARTPATEEVIEQAMFRLLGTVESVDSRDLLYRLCIVIGEFGVDELSAVAEVSPSIARAREAYNHLLGLWVEKRTDKSFVVCPLVAGFGAKELSTEVEKGVANRLGDLLFAKGKLSPIDFLKGLQYLRRARNGVLLGMRVLKGLEVAIELPPDWQQLFYQTLSADRFLDDCPISLGLLIKARQMKLLRFLGVWDRQLVEQANMLIERSANTDRWAVFGYASQAMSIISKHDLDEALQLCGIALNSFDEVVGHRNEIMGLSEELGEDFVHQSSGAFPWFLVADLHNPPDFMRWFELVTTQPEERMRQIFTSDLARDGLRIALDRLWMMQHEIPKQNRDFRLVLDAYGRASEFFREKNLRLCEAEVARSQIILYAEYLDNLPRAVEIADTFLNDGENSDEMKFLIHDVIGRQYLYAKQKDDAILHLSKASELDTQTFNGIRCRTLIELSSAIGDDEPRKSREYAEMAVAVAKRNPADVPTLDMVAALGEAALAAGFEGNYVSTFSFMDDAYRYLWNEFEELPEWKVRGVFLGNALGYFASMAATGRPPTSDYAVPRRGHFIHDNNLVSDWFDQKSYKKFDLSAPLLVMFANVVGKHDRAKYWANKGIDDARKSGMLATIHIFADEVIPQLIVAGKFDEALDYAFEASTAAVAAFVAHRENPHSDIRVKLEAIELLGKKPNNDWRTAEQDFLFMGVIPVMTYALIQSHGCEAIIRMLNDECIRRAANASEPILFRSVSDAIRLFLSNNQTTELHQKGLDESQKNNTAGATVCYLLSSLAGTAQLNNAIIYHAIILNEMSRRYRLGGGIFRFLIEQYTYFWVEAKKQQGFRFANPRHVDEEFEALAKLTPDKKAKRLVRIVADGLGVHLPKSLKSVLEWLNS